MKQILIFCFVILLLVGIGLLMPNTETAQKNGYDTEVVVPTGTEDLSMAIVYQGQLYQTSMPYEIDLPEDAIMVGQICEVTSNPQRELACTEGTVGDNVYEFEFEGNLCIARELSTPKDTPPTDAKNMLRGKVIGMSADDVRRYKNTDKS